MKQLPNSGTAVAGGLLSIDKLALDERRLREGLVGKSSLALILCEALGGRPAQRSAARKILGAIEGFDNAFPQRNEPWLIIPIVGRRADPIADLREALADAVARETGLARTKRRKAEPTGRDVIERLHKEATAKPDAGHSTPHPCPIPCGGRRIALAC